jgi:hypothetical protein
MARIAKRRDSRPLEKDIENKGCAYGKSTGWTCMKFTSPARRSVPDRMCLHDFGTIIFIEYKRFGEKPTEAQKKEHRRLRARGFKVFVIDNVEDAKRVLDQFNPYN